MPREILPLEPNPVIEAYKKDVDRTLLRENLKLTPTERMRKFVGVLEFVTALRNSRRSAPRPTP